MENKNSKDLYGVSTSFLKKIIYGIAHPLAYIYNLSFRQGKIPEMLKVSRVVPIFKSGDPKFMNNYRPVGLTAKFFQILEKLVYKA